EWQRLLANSVSEGASRARSVMPLDPLAQREAVDLLARWSAHVRAIPVDDRAALRRAASMTSGMFAAASVSSERAPGPLDRLSRQLARIGDNDPSQRRTPVQPDPAVQWCRSVSRMLWSTHSAKTANIALLQALIDCYTSIAAARQADTLAQSAAVSASQARQALT